MPKQLLAASLLMGAVVASLVAARELSRQKAPAAVHASPPASTAQHQAPAPQAPLAPPAKVTAPSVPKGPWPYGMDVTNDAWTYRTYVHASVPPIRIVARGRVHADDIDDIRKITVDGFKGLE